MSSSKPVRATTNAKGRNPPTIPKLTTKPANTLSMVCPAVKLANNRTARLIGRDKYEITSIGIISGHNIIETPGGTKKLKKCIPCFTKPKIVTPIKTVNAIANVTITWLVKVKL